MPTIAETNTSNNSRSETLSVGGVSVPATGTGRTCRAREQTTLTGGGAFPSITNGITANCTADNSTNVASCLQAAANAARDANVPLLIPYKPQAYAIGTVIYVYGSVIGVGGMPTIRMITPGGQEPQSGLAVMSGSHGWMSNLHVVGTFNGSNANSEFAPNVYIETRAGYTVSHCLLEGGMGDNIADSVTTANVIIDNNTLNSPRRCNVALVDVTDGWLITNNIMLATGRYTDPILLEPWHEASYLFNIEVAYNQIISVYPQTGVYSGIIGVADAFDSTPGGNISVHHNYGDWGVQFEDGGPYEYIYHDGYVRIDNNVEGGPSSYCP